MSEHFKDHANVSSVDTADFEIIKQLYTSTAEGVAFITFTYLKNEVIRVTLSRNQQRKLKVAVKLENVIKLCSASQLDLHI